MKSPIFLSLAISVVVVSAVSCCECKECSEEYPKLHGQITYFQEKHELYKALPINKGDVVFMGDDVADRGMWCDFYQTDIIKNRGIALEGTECSLYRIGDIAKCKPSKIFLSTGLFDLKKGERVVDIKDRIVKIAAKTKKISPKTELYYLSIIPDIGSKRVVGSLKDSAIVINEYLKDFFQERYIDIYTLLSDSTGYISDYYCFGDNRINGAGYEIISKAVAPYIGLTPQNTIALDPVMVSFDKSISPQEYYANFYKERYAHRSAHYMARVSIFHSIPNTTQKIVMLGNSITNNCWWDELLGISPFEIINRGISGDSTDGIIERLDEVKDENPAKIYMLTGINDLLENKELTKEGMWGKYELLLKSIREKMPQAELVVSTTLPLNPISKFYPGINEKVEFLNSKLEESAQKYNYRFIDLASHLKDSNGDLDLKYTCDGIHLLPEAYLIWKELI